MLWGHHVILVWSLLPEKKLDVFEELYVASRALPAHILDITLKTRHEDSFMTSIPRQCFSALAGFFVMGMVPLVLVSAYMSHCSSFSPWNTANQQKLLPKLMSNVLTQQLCRLWVLRCFEAVTPLARTWHDTDLLKKKKNLQLAYFMWKKSKIIAMCLYIRQELADYICSALLPLIRDIWSILLMVPPPLRFLCCLHILLMYLVSCVLINQHCS